jgi:hypothetical protein
MTYVVDEEAAGVNFVQAMVTTTLVSPELLEIRWEGRIWLQSLLYAAEHART